MCKSDHFMSILSSVEKKEWTSGGWDLPSSEQFHNVWFGEKVVIKLLEQTK